MDDINEIFAAKEAIEIGDDELLTNFYVCNELMNAWIERGQVFVRVGDRTLLLLRTRKGFCHLYFASTDPTDLTARLIDLRAQSDCTISVDLVGNCSEVSTCFDRAGFERYISLTRMCRLNTPAPTESAVDDWFAAPHEADAVEEIIYENMDPLGEQIPDIEEIRAAIDNRNVLVARHRAEVAAILFFNRIGVTVYLRFWASRKKFRGLGYGGLVYNRYVAINADARRFILWVRDDNDAVKKIYRTHGMSFDNLHDEVRLSKGKCTMKNSIENDRLAQLRTDPNGGGVDDRLSVDEIRRAKDFVKSNGDEFITNFFVADDLLEKLIARDEIKYSLSNKSLIVVRKCDGVSKIYFFSVDHTDLISSIRMMLPIVKRPIAVEVLVDRRQADQSELVQKHLLEIGFKHHATQLRLTKIVNTNEYGEIEPQWYAVESDCNEILEILRNDFDVLCDQVPDADELITRINNKEVLVSRQDDKIASVIIFKRGRALTEWLFWVTRPEERTSFHGLRLRDEYLKLTGKVRRQILYVRERKMLRFHQRFGFNLDGFENRVFVLD